jgi:hypothetical protein
MRYNAEQRDSTKITHLGVEYSTARATVAKEKGFNVLQANFLEITPEPIYDLVLMNPPFYGKHYQLHVNHARKFLRKGGACYAILPITAVTDHGFVEDTMGRWKDLPTGAFSASGTNINTGIATFNSYSN